jgi:hypothetical protein
MRKALLLPFLALTIPHTALANTTDLFTITGDSHVYTFTLPEVFSFPDQLHLVALPAQRTTGTIDGVGGQTFDVTFFTDIGTSGISLEFSGINVPGGGITLAGAPLASLLGQSGTPGHFIDTAEITAVGSGRLIDLASSPKLGPDYYYLTITPETDPSIPEPSTLLLLTTGALGLLSAVRRRRVGRNLPVK